MGNMKKHNFKTATTVLILAFACLLIGCKPEKQKEENSFDFKKYKDAIFEIDTFVDKIEYYEDFDILRLKGIRPTRSIHSFAKTPLIKGYLKINEDEFVLFIVGKETSSDKIYHFPIFFKKVNNALYEGELYTKSRRNRRVFYLSPGKFVITGNDNFPNNMDYCYADNRHVRMYSDVLADDSLGIVATLETRKPKVEFDYFYEGDSIRLENVIPKREKQKILKIGKHNLFFILTNT